VGPRLDLAATLAIASDDAYVARFAGTPLLRAGRRGLLRNAAVVARNVAASGAVPALEALARGDREPLVSAHALWALAGLDPARAARLADRARTADADALVLEEAEAVLSGAAA
jgi:epoxyqueuosine reductase